LPLIGIAFSLAALPLFTGIGFLSLGFFPYLWVIASFDILRKSLNYAITRPAREILYTVVKRSEKYKAKSFIDTFVYRGGDAIASIAFESIQTFLKLGLTGMAFSAIPVAFIWILNGLFLGKSQKKKAESPS